MIGKNSGIVVRVLGCIFAAASGGLMVAAHKIWAVETFGAFICVMVVESLWSFVILCIVDICILRFRGIQLPRALLIVFCLGDWLLGMACFAVACGSASAVDFMHKINICYNGYMACHTYAIASVLAFLSSVFIAISAIAMFRLVVVSFVS